MGQTAPRLHLLRFFAFSTTLFRKTFECVQKFPRIKISRHFLVFVHTLSSANNGAGVCPAQISNQTFSERFDANRVTRFLL
ncbi:MAG: hypothetical protein C0507_03270 [Cyanobacteria bacterium PR.3.49]|nr:hypothetical protein [Cyanobacteria bacterium PR.3.49]